MKYEKKLSCGWGLIVFKVWRTHLKLRRTRCIIFHFKFKRILIINTRLFCFNSLLSFNLKSSKVIPISLKHYIFIVSLNFVKTNFFDGGLSCRWIVGIRWEGLGNFWGHFKWNFVLFSKVKNDTSHKCHIGKVNQS